MNHAELADRVAASLDLSKADARKAVDAVFAVIADAAAKGDEVSVSGFGKFKVKAAPAREGRNPSTGETIQIKASKKLGFSPAKAVKDRLKDRKSVVEGKSVSVGVDLGGGREIKKKTKHN